MERGNAKGGERVALVTGAASGLGLAIATRLAEDGFLAICVDKSENVSKRAAEICSRGLKAEIEVLDLVDTDAIVAMIRKIGDRYQRIDVLVNCAGIGISSNGVAATVEQTRLDHWNRALSVNLTATFLLSREVLPYMTRAGWGRIINISSRAGRTFVPGSGAAYSASKAGLIGLTRVLAVEGAACGITANVIAPGRFDTPMANRAPPEAIERATALIPVGRIGRPNEVAATAAFLVTDDAGYITGASIDINGGAFMG
jgi:3-oxoacyl-[acyl-carrier protein] reductase